MKTFVLKSAPKHCELDPILIPLLFECLDETLPAITHVINSSLTSDIISSVYKTAVVKPLLKKLFLHQNDIKSNRPVSKLSFISKIIEKIVLSKISDSLKQKLPFQPHLICVPAEAQYRDRPDKDHKWFFACS